MADQTVLSLLELVAETKNFIYQEPIYKVLAIPNQQSKVEPPVRNLKVEAMQSLSDKVAICHQCPLAQTRTQTVFGSGNVQSKLLLVGEAPGLQEDKQGLPFVGQAGVLLTKMLKAINIEREQIYICNVLKCRPPENRNPQAEEVELCSPYLDQQINLIDPKVIVTLGNFATQHILKITTGITRMRGKTYNLNDRIVLPTYHPSALLHNQQLKRAAWHDLKVLRLLLEKLNIHI